MKAALAVLVLLSSLWVHAEDHEARGGGVTRSDAPAKLDKDHRVLQFLPTGFPASPKYFLENFAESLPNAHRSLFQERNEKPFAEEIAKLFGLTNDASVKKAGSEALKAKNALKDKEPIDGFMLDFLDRVIWASNRIQGKPITADPSQAAKAEKFIDAFVGPYKDEVKKNEETNELLIKAAFGETPETKKAAREKLFKEKRINVEEIPTYIAKQTTPANAKEKRALDALKELMVTEVDGERVIQLNANGSDETLGVGKTKADLDQALAQYAAAKKDGIHGVKFSTSPPQGNFTRFTSQPGGRGLTSEKKQTPQPKDRPDLNATVSTGGESSGQNEYNKYCLSCHRDGGSHRALTAADLKSELIAKMPPSGAKPSATERAALLKYLGTL